MRPVPRRRISRDVTSEWRFVPRSGSRFTIGTYKGTYTSRDIGMTYWLERAEAEMRVRL
jgi:hypothetical protein